MSNTTLARIIAIREAAELGDIGYVVDLARDLEIDLAGEEAAELEANLAMLRELEALHDDDDLGGAA